MGLGRPYHNGTGHTVPLWVMVSCTMVELGRRYYSRARYNVPYIIVVLVDCKTVFGTLNQNGNGSLL